ncbi:MAG: hypothetical protein EBR38_00230 [Flavobacteriaceae bacterium]|jgi:hypothetical protein|nr:hypothetical protein [Flavobacteriaceae bacterium]
MKNTLICLILLFGINYMFSQEIADHTIGLRMGSNRGFGTEISYQMKIKSDNRAEFNLGWRTSNSVNAIKLNGLYQWVWPLEQGFNWYAGVGGGLGSFSNKNINNSGSFIFAAGDIGIEYNFDFPLQASIDLRPEIGGNGYFDNSFGVDLALGIRYRF